MVEIRFKWDKAEKIKEYVVKGMDEKWDEERPSNYEIEFGNCVNRIEVLDGFSAGFY